MFPADDDAFHLARRRFWRTATLTVVGTVVVAALVIVGIRLLGGPSGLKPNTVTPSAAAAPSKGAATAPSLPPSFSQPRVNVLLIGSDAGPDRVGVRTDTMIVASIDTHSGAMAMFGLPRNLEHAPFPPDSPQAARYPDGYVCPAHQCLLNSLWTWANGAGAQYYRGEKNPGLTATTQAAEQITGLTMDDTVVVNLAGLPELVNAVGGVDLNVRERLPIGGNSEHPYALSWIKKGHQHLNGHQALWYARSRWSTNDFDRMHRQQCLLTALARQVDTARLLRSYSKVIKAVDGNLQTSIRPAQIPMWAELVAKVSTADIHRVGLGIDGDRANPNYPRIRTQVKAVLQAPALDNSATASNPTATATAGRPRTSDSGWGSSPAC